MFRAIGEATLFFIGFTGSCWQLFWQSLCHILRREVGWGRTLQQLASIGADSLPIATITLLFAGGVVGLQTAQTFVRFGATGLIGYIAVSVAREVGPVLTGVVLAARVGSAIAAELSSMTITEQVDALRSLAISPVQFLVVPRLLASVLALPMLTVFSDVIGTFGGFLVSITRGVTAPMFANSVRMLLSEWDFYGGIAKTVVFGAIIAVVGCQRGLSAQGGAAGVGQATISAVVLSIVLIYISNYFLSSLVLTLSGLFS